jgi:hypothetical protein
MMMGMGDGGGEASAWMDEEFDDVEQWSDAVKDKPSSAVSKLAKELKELEAEYRCEVGAPPGSPEAPSRTPLPAAQDTRRSRALRCRCYDPATPATTTPSPDLQ